MAAVCPAVSLPSGYPMPAVGLGTFDNLKENEPVFEAVKVALDSGYRLIDGAYIYRSEDAVGKAIADRIQAGVVRREDLFVTTKLWGTFHQPDRVEQGLRASLEQLGLQWVDLCLMHWPMAFQVSSSLPSPSRSVPVYLPLPGQFQSTVPFQVSSSLPSPSRSVPVYLPLPGQFQSTFPFQVSSSLPPPSRSVYLPLLGQSTFPFQVSSSLPPPSRSVPVYRPLPGQFQSGQFQSTFPFQVSSSLPSPSRSVPVYLPLPGQFQSTVPFQVSSSLPPPSRSVPVYRPLPGQFQSTVPFLVSSSLPSPSRSVPVYRPLPGQFQSTFPFLALCVAMMGGSSFCIAVVVSFF
ncbi:hypothetical protein ACOMHN_009267 [Nucella lapillus]